MLPATLIIGTILSGSVAFKVILAKRFHSIVYARREFVRSFGGPEPAVSKAGICVLTLMYVIGSFFLMSSIGLLFFLLNSSVSHA